MRTCARSGAILRATDARLGARRVRRQLRGAAAAHHPLADDPRSRRSAAVLRDVLREHRRLHALDHPADPRGRRGPARAPGAPHHAPLLRRPRHGADRARARPDQHPRCCSSTSRCAAGTSSRTTRRSRRWFYIVRAGAIASAVILLARWSFLIIGLFFFREHDPPPARDGWGACCRRASATRGCTSSTRSPRRWRSRSTARALVEGPAVHGRRLGLPDRRSSGSPRWPCIIRCRSTRASSSPA